MKKKLLIIIPIVLVLVGILVFFIIKMQNRDIPIVYEKTKDFKFVGIFDYENPDDTTYVFKNYEDYISRFNNDLLTKDDFKNNNYVLIYVYYDECSEKEITPIDYKINGKNIDVTFKYTASCGVCAPRTMYYLLKVDKTIDEVVLNTNYEASNKVHCNQYVTYKPLIYLYPTKEMDVKVELGYKNLLTVTYPKYNNGWNVHVYPNGDIKDINGKTYYGLYWEALNFIDSDFENGFVVKKEDSVSFLEEKLEILGLNEREANEFIIYWLPKLEENEYNLIRFETMEAINEQMPLYITPEPDTIIRVLMEYKPLNEKIEIPLQQLTKTSRNGFVVVEWGGSLIK